ncbi:MAG: DMT family transporter [Rhodospirillaceae bacterium]
MRRPAPSARPARSATPVVPLLILLAVGGGWGAVPSVARIAVTGGIGPMGYVFWVGTAAALVCWAMCLVRGVRPRFGRRHIRYYLLSGCSRILIAGFAMYTVLQHVPAGTMAIVLGTAPLLTFVAQVALGYEKFTLVRGAGLLLGLSGILAMFAPAVAAPAGGVPLGWLAVGFVTPLTYAFSNITIDRSRPAGEDSLALTTGMFVLVAVIALPASLALGQFHPLWRSGFTLPEAAMFGHAAIIAVCFVGLYELIRRTDATFGSQSIYVTTLTGILFGMLLLGERPGIAVWIAALCILGGIGLVNSGGKVRGKAGAG